MGVCNLCLQDRDLVEGHVFPEFLYAELYDPATHKFHQLHTDVSRRNLRRSKGLYERLMCNDCDNRIISGYESHASKVLNGGTEIPIVDEPDRILVGGLDYSNFKLFQISLLWRAVISTMEEFQAAKTTAAHAERMRRMLLTNDPGEPHEYGCVMLLPELFKDVQHGILPPEPIRIAGHWCFRFLAGGFWWLIVVSRHSATFVMRQWFLAADGTLVIGKESASTQFFHELAAHLVKNPTYPAT